jgi:hypothetical protein
MSQVEAIQEETASLSLLCDCVWPLKLINIGKASKKKKKKKKLSDILYLHRSTMSVTNRYELVFLLLEWRTVTNCYYFRIPAGFKPLQSNKSATFDNEKILDDDKEIWLIRVPDNVCI